MNQTGTLESAEHKFKQILEEFFISMYDEKSLSSHGIDHHRRVWNYSKELIKNLTEDKPWLISEFTSKLIIACYLHDIGMSVEPGIMHGKFSKELCVKFLTEYHLNKQEFIDVLEAIEFHDRKDYQVNKENKVSNELLTILSVADDLDAFGFIGIFRYSDIYLTREINPEDIGKLIKENALKRYNHFIETFGSADALVQKHKKKYEILDKFFSEYNRQVVSYKFGGTIPKGYCGVVEHFKTLLQNNISLNDFISNPANYSNDPVILWFFNELKNELTMNKPESKIPSPFNPENFRKEGHILIDRLSDYLEDALSGRDMPVLPWNDPDKLAGIFSFESGGGANESLDNYFKRIIEHSIHIHHPNYIGHQVTSPLPVAVLAQFCTTLLNNGAAIYEMGPVNMAMERNVVERFGKLIGYQTGFDGIFTHGGTAGNLTGMLAARQAKTDYNIWEEGVKSENRPGYMMSEQSHYSIGRNVKIMGLGEDSIVKVPFDNNFRMRIDLLEEYRKRAEDKGIKVISLAANSCSTATGSYDDLDKIADFCEKHGLWLHVDGAHGLGVLFSEKHRNHVKSIERADSIVIDFHKMLLVPALNTLVMFRNGERSFETFAQKASYLFQKSQNNVWYNSAIRTIECTKSALGIIAYTAMKYYGDSYYKEYIDSRYSLASEFAAIVRAEQDIELAVEPESNIVCFRYAPEGYNELTLNQINSNIRDTIIKEGSYYIVQAELGGKIWIRLTIINPVTSEEDLRALLKRVLEIGKKHS